MEHREGINLQLLHLEEISAAALLLLRASFQLVAAVLVLALALALLLLLNLKIHFAHRLSSLEVQTRLWVYVGTSLCARTWFVFVFVFLFFVYMYVGFVVSAAELFPLKNGSCLCPSRNSDSPPSRYAR